MDNNTSKNDCPLGEFSNKELNEEELQTVSGGTKLPHNIEYTVKRGDTLEKIAQHYGTSWKDIYNNNRGKLKNPHLITEGMILTIPATRNY